MSNGGGFTIKPGAKILLGVIALALVSFGLYQARNTTAMQNLFPVKKEPGAVSADDFNAPGNNTKIAKSDDKTINVGIVTWGGYAGGIVANNGFEPTEDSIFYKKFGQKVRLVVIDDFVQSRAAFATGGKKGGIDIVWSTVDAYALEYPQLAKQGLDPKAIIQYDWSRGGDAIAVTKDINEIADLKGKKIAVAQATPSHYFGLWALAQGNVKNSEVEWVFTSSAPEAANLFKAGKVDACISWSPDVYLAAEARGKILISTREATNLIADIFVARGDFLKERPEAARAFVKGWLEGVEEAKENPGKAVRLMAENFQGIGPADAEGMWKDVYLPNYQENLRFFGISGENDPTGFQPIFETASRIWNKIGESNQIGNVRESYDGTILQAVNKEVKQGTVDPASKPDFKPATQAQAQKKAVLNKRISVYFKTGSGSLDENAKYILDLEIANLASTFGNAYIRISGNTDNVGNRNSNIQLSRQRAEAVKKHLSTKYKFPENKFIVQGNGPDKPIANNNTEEGRSQNRRTDFEVIPR